MTNMMSMMPTRLSISATLVTINSKVSVSCNTSLWLRDIILPTGVLWKNDGERSCRWLNIWVRNWYRMLWLNLGMKMAWMYMAVKYDKDIARKTKATRWRRQDSKGSQAGGVESYPWLMPH